MSRIRESLVVKHFDIIPQKMEECGMRFTIHFNENDVELGELSHVPAVKLGQINQLIDGLKMLQKKLSEIGAVCPTCYGSVRTQVGNRGAQVIRGICDHCIGVMADEQRARKETQRNMTDEDMVREDIEAEKRAIEAEQEAERAAIQEEQKFSGDPNDIPF